MAAALAGSRQYGTYLELQEVMDFLNMPVGGGVNTTTLQRFIDSSCTRIQRAINRPVGAQEFWERHDGWSGEYIMLHETPFLELVSCYEWQSSGGQITLAESTPENPIDGIQIDYGTGRIMRTFAGYSWPRPFFPGSRNIEITYMAGFNPVPPDIWEATADWIGARWRASQQPNTRPVEGDVEDRTGPFQGMPISVISAIQDYRLPSIA